MLRAYFQPGPRCSFPSFSCSSLPRSYSSSPRASAWAPGPWVPGLDHVPATTSLHHLAPPVASRHWLKGAATAGAFALAPVPGASLRYLTRYSNSCVALCNIRGRRDFSLKEGYQACTLGRIDILIIHSDETF